MQNESIRNQLENQFDCEDAREEGIEIFEHLLTRKKTINDEN